MIEQIKQLRVEIDGLAQLCEALKPITKPIGGLDRYKYEEMIVNSEEVKEAVKSLKLSKAWLGKILEQLGNENPYGSGYKTVEDIVPASDVASKVTDYPVAPAHWPEGEVTKSHIEKVDWLRTEIKRLIDNTTDYSQEVPEIELEQGFAYKYLCEARFWLGFELSRVRDESK